MKKLLFTVVLMLLTTTSLFGQGTQINALTQMKPNVVLTSVVTITPTQLKAMGVDGSNAVTLVSYDGTHVIVPMVITFTLIPGTTAYDPGDIGFNVFNAGSPGATNYLGPGAATPSALGLDALTKVFSSQFPFSQSRAFSVFQTDVVFGGVSGTTPLTLGDSSLQVTVAYMLI